MAYRSHAPGLSASTNALPPLPPRRAAATISHVNVAAGVFLAAAAIWLLRTVWGRANPGARLAAIGGSALALWLLVGAVNAAAAGRMSGWLLSGAVTDVTGIGHLVSAL